MSTPEVKEFRLENLTCASCAMKFEENVKKMTSVDAVQVNFGASKMTLQGEATIEQLEAAGAFDGIKVLPLQQHRVAPPVPFWKRKENIVTLLSLLFLLAGAWLSFQHGEAYPGAIVLFATAIAVGGAQMFRTGLQNLLRFEFDMKTLMTIAIIGAALIGEWREGAVVVFLFAVSEALEAYSMNKARQSIRQLMDIAPPTAFVRRGSQLIELPTEEVEVGDILLVKPGQKIAMDGQVLSGASTVNQAAITGESIPVMKKPGDEVFAGTLNEEGALEIEVTKRVEDTTIAKIIHLVEEAQAEKAPSQKFVDRFAKYYTPIIIVLAILIAIVPPLFGGDWNAWIYQGLAVLVVGCPCALVVSTPVAIVTAIGNAARKGVLIKGGVHLEEAGRLQAVAFDKTGTLTKGYPEVTDCIIEANYDTKQALASIAAVEAISQHPLAKAIVRYANAKGAPIKEATGFQSVTGKGAYAQVDGQRVGVGSLQWASEQVALPETTIELAHTLQQEGKSVMAFVIGDQLGGLIAVADSIRAESPKVIQQLKEIGMQHIVMLTGDHEQTATAIAHRVGVTDVQANLMPADKLQAIRQLRSAYGRVAMVGDGVNDAPALASASVGIAMGGAGTDAALETADVAFMSDDLSNLPYTIKLSRKTLRIIKENIMFALGLKLIALLLIIPGWLTLWIAIFADMGATLLVVFNSLRLLRVRK